MRVVLTAVGIAAIVFATVSVAEPQFPNRDRPGHVAYHDVDAAAERTDHSERSHRHDSGGHRRPSWGGAYRVPVPYPHRLHPGYYPPYHSYPPPYSSYHPPYHGYYPPYYIPPVFVPAETLYGPRAVQRFMGVDHWFQQPQPEPQPMLVVPHGGGQAAEPGALPPAEPEDSRPGRGTNAQALNLAWRFIGFGDAHFANQNYAEANDRYRKAATAAPQLADAYFRQGYALLAVGRYDLSVRAIRRGMDLDAGWPQSGFHNAELYGDGLQAKAAHLEALAIASEKDPHNADLLFLVGMMLHFDGKAERAEPFFDRAVQLLAGNDGHVRAFLHK